MSAYTLPHILHGERSRLALMSSLLDPVERTTFERLGVGPGSRCLEFGSGNGSIARILAGLVAPTGRVVASDFDLRFLHDVKAPCLEVRRIDVLNDEIEQAAYDLVVARALLHHLPDAETALKRMAGAVRPGGAWLSVEPDMLPCTVAEPASMRSFWRGWLDWAAEAGIDYFVGRKISAWLDSLGFQEVAGEGRTPLFNGGSDWARYWVETVQELAPALMRSGHVTAAMLEDFTRCFDDAHYWTSPLTFVATWGRKPL